VSKINSIRKSSFLVFILPFLSVNICLILSQIFIYIDTGLPETSGSFFYNLKLFDVGDAISEKGLPWIIPYIDGVASISRVVRVYPNYLIFKPAMLITGVMLIRYWVLNKNLINDLEIKHKDINKCLYFGISSAIFLILHSIFLGIKFDFAIYKLFRRVILLLFIIFEITAQFYLIKIKFLILKKFLVYSLILAAILIFPFLPFNNLKILKHMLEWNYFMGVITFYLLTFFMWKKSHN